MEGVNYSKAEGLQHNMRSMATELQNPGQASGVTHGTPGIEHEHSKAFDSAHAMHSVQKVPGPPSEFHGHVTSDCYNYKMNVQSPETFGGRNVLPKFPVQPEKMDRMFENYMRSDMFSLYNNPYVFPRACSFSDWMSMQHMYNNYMEFLNYIGESRAPLSSSPSIKMQSVQTQTPLHEFKSTMIQTDPGEPHNLSVSTNAECLPMYRSDEETPGAVNKSFQGQTAAITEEYQTDVESRASMEQPKQDTTERSPLVEDSTDLPQQTAEDHPLAEDNGSYKVPPIKEDMPLTEKKPGSSNANFLDNDDLLMPVPRSRGRGRKPASNKNDVAPCPGTAGTYVQNKVKADCISPGSRIAEKSNIARSRGRGHPPNLKLIIPTKCGSRNTNNDGKNSTSTPPTPDSPQCLQKYSPDVDFSDEGRNIPKHPSNTEVVPSPTTSVPPGFEARAATPGSPLPGLNLMALPPFALLSVGKTLQIGGNDNLNEQRSNTTATDVAKTGRQSNSAPPGFSVSDSVYPFELEESVAGKNHGITDKKVPHFGTGYNAKKTSIQKYLRASLADDKKRRRVPLHTPMERIDEKKEEEMLSVGDSKMEVKSDVNYHNEMQPHKIGQSQNTLQKTEGEKDFFVSSDTKSKSHQGCQQEKVFDPTNMRCHSMGKFPTQMCNGVQGYDKKSEGSPPVPFHTAEYKPKDYCINKAEETRKDEVKKCDNKCQHEEPTPEDSPSRQYLKHYKGRLSSLRHRYPQFSFSNSNRLPSNSNVKMQNDIPERMMGSSDNWDEAETDIFVPCKWYEKQLQPVYEAMGKKPDDFNTA